MSRMSDGKKEVVVTDIEMPFASMVVFMVKWAIASIPAMILLGAVASLFWLLVYGLFGGGTLKGGLQASQFDRAQENCKASDDQATCMGRYGFRWDGFKWVPK
jgi:hypothetical protein